ncbi:DEKNAAC105369 [Brettanomyces naardenensis]|uniref:DEKNAAC105369 n=1 Tax=Brettanomyces naardenensis TaxID=13370 RepID=A0A448YTA0_BRENA|nr:DEKNAAC105369 [Brettanomyces naardenensis]
MAPNSPNNSTLTISPLVSNRRARDYFQTPPPIERRRVHSTHRIFSSPNRQNTVNVTNSLNLNATSAIDTAVDALPSKGLPLPLPSSSFDESQLRPEESINLEDVPLTQADKLRLWRHDALLQHHYTTAIYIGDKVLNMTGDPNDAFWLAQVYYAKGDYQMARNLLSGTQFEDSVSCRYLSGLCLVKLERYDEALDIVGEVNPFKKDHSVKNPDGGIKLEASMCYLRGLVYARQNNFERAKESYKEAVLVDVKCFEAFNELVSNSMLTPDEEWDLLAHLDFDDADNNSGLVRLLYTTRLSKYRNVRTFEESEQRLKDEYSLEGNLDLMLAKADLLYVQCRFHDCLDLCRRILEKNELNLQILPNYLSCLYETGGKNELFLAAHKLAENYPNNYITWLAIGIYYFAIGRTNDARLFFSKASILNPSFGPAWIGFAHTFAVEGEHEQAISAYATASRLFPGSHLPNLFLGMQYLQMNNLTLAQEYLLSSMSVCATDPLLLNELGVLYYNRGQLSKSETFLQKALLAAQNLDSGAKAWCSIHCNLGHVYRRLKKYKLAISHFEEVLRMSKTDANIYSSLGLIYLKLGRISKAIEMLHSALWIQPNDPIATDLLDKGLEANMKVSSRKFIEEHEDTDDLRPRLSKHRGAIPETPINKPAKNVRFIGQDKRKDLDLIVEDLRRGEDSSEEDGDDVMEMESD